MASMGGCTGMDVVSLAKKMRQEVESLEIVMKGSIADEHPMKYEAIHMIFQFTGKDLDAEKLQKCVDMSQDKYCGVAATLKGAVKLTYEISIK
jgi:putative redox protein